VVTKRKINRPAPKPPTDFGSGIVPIEDLETNLVMLVYGRSGTGKTHFMSTFPKPLLLIDVNERGTETIKATPQVFVRRVEDWETWESAYEFLKGKTQFKSVIIDQITSLQDLGMRHIRQRTKKAESDLFSRKNWGELAGTLKTSLSNFRELSDRYHIGLVAHERVFGGEEEGEDNSIEPSITARVMPSVGTFVEGAVDAIGHTFIRERIEKVEGKRVRRVEYCMRVGPHSIYTTKIRRPVEAGAIPDLIVDPTFQKIIDLVSGKSLKRKVRKA